MAKLNPDIALKLAVCPLLPPPSFKVPTVWNGLRTSLCMFITMSQAPKADYPFVLQQPTIHSNEFKIEWLYAEHYMTDREEIKSFSSHQLCL